MAIVRVIDQSAIWPAPTKRNNKKS